MAVTRKKPKHTVREFMTADPKTIGPHDTLAQAHQMMEAAHVRHLPVIENDEPVGVVSERDLMMIERYHDVDPAHTEVYEAMAPLPFRVTADASLEEVAEAMADNRYGSALVVDGGRLVGVFTTVDALRATRKLCRETARRAR